MKKDRQRKISLFIAMVLLLGMAFPAWAATANVWIEGLGYNDVSGSVYGTVYTDTYDTVSSGVYAAVYCNPETTNYSSLLSWTPVSGSLYKTVVFNVPRPVDMPTQTVHTVVYDSNKSTSLSPVYDLMVPSNNANLSSLNLSSGSLNPNFDPNTVGYTAAEPYSVNSITITPTADDANATIKVNGSAVASGQASGAVNLNVGDNSFAVVVYAQDNMTTKTYTLTVNRAAPSNNANLSSLTLSTGSLSPAFDGNTTSYSAAVANGVSSVTLTPNAADENTTIKVNGTAVPSGQASNSIALNVGDNTITVTVHAQDNVTTKIYTVNVTRAAANGGGGGSGGSSTNITTSAPVSATINASTGGTVSTSDGYLSVIFPAGSLSSEGQVSISEVTGSNVPPAGINLIIGDKVFNITLEGASLVKPVILTFKYDTARFANVPADRIGLYYYNESRNAWLHVGGDVDTASGIVTAEVTHFTKFAVMANPSLPAMKDIDAHWAKKDIEHLVGLLAINGYPDSTFKPDNSITRAEFATILAKAMGWTANSGAASFKDTVPDWAGGYVGAAVEKGVIKGYEDNTFRADRLISRAEMAVIVVRALGKDASDKPLTFSDASDVPAWAAGYVATAVDNGIITGMPGNVFNQNGNATRAETSAVVNRLLNSLKI